MALKPNYSHGIGPAKPKAITGATPPSMDVPLQGYSRDPYSALGVAPPGASSAPATGTGQLPWDAQYETQSGLLNRNFQNQEAALAQQETDTRSQYGFDAQYASNPLTKANLLQRSYEQGRLGATNSMAARGQLYSGATSNALGYEDFNHASNYNNLQTEYQGLLNKISQGHISDRQGLDEGVANAKADALSRALAQDPESIAPDVPGGGSGDTAGARKNIKKNAKKNPKSGITYKGQTQKSNLKGKK